eukprot:Clim_evm22s230 gene=Clim_evmTU22s230
MTAGFFTNGGLLSLLTGAAATGEESKGQAHAVENPGSGMLMDTLASVMSSANDTIASLFMAPVDDIDDGEVLGLNNGHGSDNDIRGKDAPRFVARRLNQSSIRRATSSVDRRRAEHELQSKALSIEKAFANEGDPDEKLHVINGMWRTPSGMRKTYTTVSKTRKNGETMVMAGDVSGLIHQLCRVDIAVGDSYTDDFLLVYPYFLTAEQLLDQLFFRFRSAATVQETKKGTTKQSTITAKQNTEDTTTLIRLRIMSMMKRWVSCKFDDFSQQPSLITKLENFIETEVASNDMLKATGKTIIDMLNTRRDPSKYATKPIFSFSDHMKDLRFLAEQMTLIHSKAFAEIKPAEFVKQAWNSKDRHVRAPNLLKLIELFNKVTHWVCTEIVTTENLNDRVKVMQKFIELAKILRDMNSLLCCIEITAAFNMAPIFRLKQTFKHLSSKHQKDYVALTELMDSSKNFGHYRGHLANCKGPVLPYVGLYLTDLVFIEDGNPSEVGEQLVNFRRLQMVAGVIRKIQEYQHSKWTFMEDLDYQKRFEEGMSTLNQEQLYEESLIREPRAGSTAAPAATTTAQAKTESSSLRSTSPVKEKPRAQTVSAPKTTTASAPDLKSSSDSPPSSTEVLNKSEEQLPTTQKEQPQVNRKFFTKRKVKPAPNNS